MLISPILSRLPFGLLVLFTGVLFAGAAPLAADETDEAPSAAFAHVAGSSAQVAELIQTLGHRRYAHRERAMRELYELGLPAVAGLHDALDHEDREVRKRARRALREIARRDRPRRLALLTSSAGAVELDVMKHPFGVPGLECLIKIAGDSPETRRMLAKALRADWELIEDSVRKDIDTLRLIELRCGTARSVETRQKNGVRPETMVAVLTAAARRDRPLPDRVAIQVYSLLSQLDRSANLFGATQQTAWECPPFRRLVGAFVLNAEGPTAIYQGLKVAMEHNLREGLLSAEKIVRGGYTLPHIRQFAILALAKFGNADHIPDLELLLDDDEVCFTRRRSSQRVNFECQIRDIAMVAILHLQETDPREFGFRQLQTSQTYVFQPHTIGFDSDEERQLALQKFREELASPE